MSRDHLMAAWADLVATGKDKPVAAVGAKSLGIPAALVHYDPELEKQRLAFAMQKYEEEKDERLRLEAKANAESLRQEEKAEAERIRLAEERHLQQISEWHKNQPTADSARQKAQEQFA